MNECILTALNIRNKDEYVQLLNYFFDRYNAQYSLNCKQLMNAARDNATFEATVVREARALVETWLDEDFPPKLLKFMQSLKKNKKP